LEQTTPGLWQRMTGNAYLMLVLTTLLWGANAVASPMAVGHLSPMTLVFLRWLVACSLLAVIARDAIVQDWPVLKTRLPFVFLMGALGYTAFNCLFYAAGHHTTAINIAILQGAMPVLVIVAGIVAYREVPNAIQWTGALVTLLGVCVIAAGGDLKALSALQFNRGDLLILVAGVLYAGYTVGLRNRPKVSALGFFAFMAGAAAVTSIPPAIAEIMLGQAVWPTAKGWLLILFIGLGPSLLAQLMFMRGVQLIGPGRTGVFLNLVPVFGPLLAVLILGEKFHVYHGVSLVLVLGGIWVSEQGRKRV
jgi:drug/metabolite transporter (DMT)-like permease